jgi:bifunctional UDP-N-acetylglucosamine pyrophosphorylase/glucosamine-1-phosphate N-acetyltransferase
MKSEPASLILAAGKGSRMKGFQGNKTLLPLVPKRSAYEGDCPILIHILKNLPNGPKAVVVHYRRKDIIKATRSFDLVYCDQPQLNGTGGALIAAENFLKNLKNDFIIITMGDVPFVRGDTYLRMLEKLHHDSIVVLGFYPKEKKQYGALDIQGQKVTGIIEWKYWRHYPREQMNHLRAFNAGIYAARREDLLDYLDDLKKRPHTVSKERNGKMTVIEEFFITDLISMAHSDGRRTGFVMAEDAREVMGIDDPVALQTAQDIFKKTTNPRGCCRETENGRSDEECCQ